MNSFEEFVSLWEEETKNKKISLAHMLFLVVYPDKLKWDFGIEKQTQTTTLMMSGGSTGGGSRHDLRFCYRSEVHDLLLGCDHTHAMIVSVGMVFDMTTGGREQHTPLVPGVRWSQTRVTPITDFYDFVQSGEFCKAHIIAKPGQQVFFHHQHMNLNLTIWRDIGTPNMSERYDVAKRSSDNFHDDYTPTWIEIEGMPTITNFSKEERERKAFSYYRNHQTESWKNLDNVDKDDYYFSRYMTRIRKQFYIENTEGLGKLPTEKFDIIFATTAGYRAAVLADKLEFDGEIVLFDYCQENLDIKQMIIEMNLSLDEIKYLRNYYSKTLDHTLIRPDADANKYIKILGSFEDLRGLDKKMEENYNIEYWLMDLISPDYDKLLKKIKGKNVFFDATNIFGYHMSHAYYTLDELVSSYKKLRGVLGKANKTFFRGTSPTKQKINGWVD